MEFGLNGSLYATRLLSCLSCLSVTLLYCGQRVGWIKLPLGTDVGLVPGDIALDGERGTAAPCHFSAMSIHFIVAKWSPIPATVGLL